MYLLIIYLVFFVVGLYFYYCNQYNVSYFESFAMDTPDCPNLLIKRGNKYLLQNTKKVIVPGVNPITFNNLAEYEEFIMWQRSQNINCPVLYLEYAYNTQGHPVYFVSPNPPFDTTNSSPEFTPRFKQSLCNKV